MVAFSTCHPQTDTFMHLASEASSDQHQSLLAFTFIVDSLPTLRSQRPPVVRHMPSPHRPSEQAPANAVLLLQPLSTDSACQLLENTLLLAHMHGPAGLAFSWKLVAPLRRPLPWLVLLVQPLQLQL